MKISACTAPDVTCVFRGDAKMVSRRYCETGLTIQITELDMTDGRAPVDVAVRDRPGADTYRRFLGANRPSTRLPAPQRAPRHSPGDGLAQNVTRMPA
jgi:hypothetical protein